MRHMVAAMPGVKREQLRERHQASFGMPEPALEVRSIQSSQQDHPAQVKRLEKIERHINRYPLRIRKLRPLRFVVCLDGRLILRQRQLESRIRIQVAVRQMMHDLLDGPSTGAVGSLYLVPGQSGHRRSQCSRRLGDLADQQRIIRRGDRSVSSEFPDREAEIARLLH